MFSINFRLNMDLSFGSIIKIGLNQLEKAFEPKVNVTPAKKAIVIIEA